MAEDRIAAIAARHEASTCGVFIVDDEGLDDRFIVVPIVVPAEASDALTRADLRMLGDASADIAYLLGEINAIERRLADDRANLRPECAGMSTADLVKAALDVREGEIQTGWDYANVVERDGDRDRKDWEAENRRLRRLIISLRTACEYALDTRDLGDLQRAIDASEEVRAEVAS